MSNMIENIKEIFKTNQLLYDFLKQIYKLSNNIYYKTYTYILSKKKVNYIPTNFTKDLAEQNIRFLHSLRNDVGCNQIYEFQTFISYDLSIIVPAYNAEKFIELSLASIVKQNTNYSYEIIIIDDKSTDGTKKIVSKFLHYSNIKYYYKSNGGAGDARNYGISKASGKYLMFVDADDAILETMVSMLMDVAIENQDVGIIQAKLLTIDSSKIFEWKTITKKLNPSYRFTKIDVERESDKIIKYYVGFPWGKIYKKELFADINFPAYCVEDTIIFMNIVHKTKRIILINDVVYLYNQNNSSTTASLKGINYKNIDTYYVVNYCLNINEKIGIQVNTLLYRQIIYQFGSSMYERTQNLGEQVQNKLFFMAGYTLNKYNNHIPKSGLTFKEKMIQKALLSQNINLYKTAIKIQ